MTDLSSDRLVLRSWTAGEAAAVLDTPVQDGPVPATPIPDGAEPAHWAEDFPAEGDRIIAELFGRYPDWLGEYGHRQIVERSTGLVVGSIGLFWPPVDGAVEIGYGVVGSRRGRGYAPEATRVLTAFALAAPGVHTVYAAVQPANRPSMRVLEKAGFARWRCTESQVDFRATTPRSTAAAGSG